MAKKPSIKIVRCLCETSKAKRGNLYKSGRDHEIAAIIIFFRNGLPYLVREDQQSLNQC